MHALIVCFCLLFFLGLQAADAKSRILLVDGTRDNCKDEFVPVREALGKLPIPDDWTFVVVCTPTAWDNLLRRADGLGKTNTAFTNLKGHYTYFNGSNFALRVATHELGHILGKTEDEERAEAMARVLQRQTSGAFPKKR
jgi:hypothetical protein